MEEEISEKQLKPQKQYWWAILLVGVVLLGIAGFTVFRFTQKNGQKEANTQTTASSKHEQVTIPQNILDNKFGWLGGDGDGSRITSNGGAWGRPHLGSFIWGGMQKGANEQISFTGTDREVSSLQQSNIGALVTIWPFAEWDQANRTNVSSCAVKENDEFLKANMKGGKDNLPLHRCNPNDWTAYQKWVTALVERYDGDGTDDMPGLKVPVKHWEAMNEPDLQWGNANLPLDEDRSLTFYKQEPADYAELLIKTNQAIKAADPEAKVLIAGAAGGETRMLNFYREVFKNTDARTAFDIGNIHCISNDEATHDFNVGPYKNMLAEFGITTPIWVTEAENMRGATAEANYLATKKSTENAIAAGVQRIFFTRDKFEDSKSGGSYPNQEKFLSLINGFQK